MAGRLTLSAPINVPNIVAFLFDAIEAYDEVAKVMRVRFLTGAPGPTVYSVVSLTITNGAADALAANGAPTSYTDRLSTNRLTGAGVATAFDQCDAAFRAGGRNQLMTQMQALGLLPAGAVV